MGASHNSGSGSGGGGIGFSSAELAALMAGRPGSANDCLLLQVGEVGEEPTQPHPAGRGRGWLWCVLSRPFPRSNHPTCVRIALPP